jgi:DegV family protein with EDD domain
MQKVAIVTDGGYGLSKKILEEYDISLVPYGLYIDGKEYKTDIDITTDKLMKIINEKKVNPKTSSISLGDLINVYKFLKKNNKSIISIFMSEKLSTATFDILRIAKKNLDNDIEIIDSLQAGPGKELIVLEAAKLAKTGKNSKEVSDYAREVISKTNSIYGVPDLMYLYRGGRIGRARALMGSAMNVIPIVAIRDMEGTVSPIGKGNNFLKVNEQIIEIIKKDLVKLKATKIKICIIEQADNIAASQHLRKVLEENIKCDEILEADLGCTALVHLGPKSWGIGYYVI